MTNEHIYLTYTGGYWSIFIYVIILREALDRLILNGVVPVFLIYQPSEKDLIQFNNAKSILLSKYPTARFNVYDVVTDIPVTRVAIDPDNFQGSKDLLTRVIFNLWGEKKFWNEWYEFTQRFINESKSDCRNTLMYCNTDWEQTSNGREDPFKSASNFLTMSIDELIFNDRYEKIPDGFEPGNGCTILPPSEMENLFFQGELLGVDYIMKAHNDFFRQNSRGAWLGNQTSETLGMDTKMIKSIGLLPNVSGTIYKTVHPHQFNPTVKDLTVETTVHKLGIPTNEYDCANTCLVNTFNSLFEFMNNGSYHITQLDKQIIERAYEYTLNDWTFQRDTMEPFPLEDIVSHRDWKNSPGYPYNKAGCTNAQQAFTHLRELIDDYFNRASKEWVPCIFNVFPKREIRKAHKCDVPRTIIAPSIDQQLVSQKWTMRICEQVGKNFKTSHTQIGRTRYRGDVHRTAMRFETKGTKVEYDAKGWDRNIKPFLLKLFFRYIYDITNKTYMSSQELREFEFELLNVAESTIYSYMITPNGELFRKCGGVPSGFTCTSYANSWIHTFVFYYVVLALEGNITQDELKERVDFVCYGDDGILGYNKSKCTNFNEKLFSELLWKHFGINVPIAEMIVQPTFEIEDHGWKISGLTFLGDIIFKHTDGMYQPIFNFSKAVHSLLFPTRTFHPYEMFLILLTHYIEVFFHPKAYVFKMLLLDYVSKFKKLPIKRTVEDKNLTDYLGHNFTTEVIAALQNNTIEKYIYDRFYAVVTVCETKRNYQELRVRMADKMRNYSDIKNNVVANLPNLKKEIESTLKLA